MQNAPLEAVPTSTERSHEPRGRAAVSAAQAERWLVFLLRLGGVVLLLAFPTMLLPVSWMAATHEALGMGPFPASPLVDYLTRSIAALYGFHGVLLFLISRDVRRYSPVILFAASMSLIFSVMILIIDLHAGVPLRWTLVEGPSVFALGLILMLLALRVRRAG